MHMQLQSEKSLRMDEVKTHFRAREGYYRLMNSPDYSQRSQRAMGFTGTANSNSSTATNEKASMKVSLVATDEHSNTARKQPPMSSGSFVNGSKPPESSRRSKVTHRMKICFNVGKELFVYNYDGVRTGPDASNPIYKRCYKGSSPTCHAFNETTAAKGSISLLVGFAHGQVRLIDLNSCDDQESCKEYNTDRLIDKTRVTCIKWLPHSSSLFLVSHASGQLYLYKDDLPCGPTAPSYQLYKQSGGVLVYTCKTKTTRNPIYKWSIGCPTIDINGLNSSLSSSNSSLNMDSESYCINEFVFSPCAKYLACVSQDGFLRVYCYDTMELIGRARSYYGGLKCVCWSPDGKYVVTGGEDDLITVWSFVDRRVVARGVGHKSWVSVVAFDSYYTGYDANNSEVDNYDEDDDEDDKDMESCDLEVYEDVEMEDETDYNFYPRANSRSFHSETRSPTNKSNITSNNVAAGSNTNSHIKKTSATTYRFGSVGQDAQLCLWDLSDDLLQVPVTKSKSGTVCGSNSVTDFVPSTSNHNDMIDECKPSVCDNGRADTSSNTNNRDTSTHKATIDSSSSMGGFLSGKGSAFTKTFSLVSKRDKRSISKSFDKNSSSKGLPTGAGGDKLIEDPVKLLGSPICPRMNEVPLIEPTVCKKISYERLTSLIFCKGGFITSCQDGYLFSWARPSRVSNRGEERDKIYSVISTVTNNFVHS